MTPLLATYLRLALAALLGFGLALAIAPAADAAVPTCFGQEVTHFGTTGNDLIEGTEDADVIAALGGNDTIYGLGGDDIICAGTGADWVSGGDGDDFIFGSWGHDVLRGGDGNDRIWAGVGNDWAYGEQGADDMVHGVSGSDVCIAETEWGCEMDYRGIRDVEEWRDLVHEHFGDIGQTDNALDVMHCESRGNPFAVGPGSNPPLGLFQHLASYWPGRAANAGWAGATAFHPEANIAATRWLYDNAGGWYPSWGGCAPGH